MRIKANDLIHEIHTLRELIVEKHEDIGKPNATVEGANVFTLSIKMRSTECLHHGIYTINKPEKYRMPTSGYLHYR